MPYNTHDFKKFYIRGHKIELFPNSLNENFGYNLKITTNSDSKILQKKILKYLVDEGFFEKRQFSQHS